jgi:ribonucleoside-diphosphate reductase alpha chain
MKREEIDLLSQLLRDGAEISEAEIERFRRCLLDDGWSVEVYSREQAACARLYMSISAAIILRLSAQRAVLPQRRAGEVFDFKYEGMGFVATIGRYPDGSRPDGGRIGEIFLNGAKLDNQTDFYARDLGMALSFALQYGATLAELRRAMTRDATGKPQGLGGHVLDLIGELQ